MTKDERKTFDKLKKFIGKNYQLGDDYIIEDAAKSILKYNEIAERIEMLGDLVSGYNGTQYKNPLYDVLKFWDNKKTNALTALGLTPYARKKLVGSAEGDGEDAKSETGTGRRKTKAKAAAEKAEESETEFC